MKNTFLILLLILACSVFYGEGETSSPISEPTITCNDSDNGTNIFVAATAWQVPEGSGTADYCDFLNNPNGVLMETVCDGNTATHVQIICPSETPYCNKAVCSAIKPACTDTDNYIDPYVKGTITEPRYPDGPEYTDYCQNRDTKQPWNDCKGELCSVREYYCADPYQTTTYQDMLCPDGCQDGVCLGTAVYTTPGETQTTTEEVTTTETTETTPDSGSSTDCKLLKTDPSTKKYFEICASEGYDGVCFNKFSKIHQGCNNLSSTNYCTLYNENANDNILCSITADTSTDPCVLLKYYYMTTCPYSQKENPVIDALESKSVCSKTERFVLTWDDLSAAKYGITGTPTMVAVNANGCTKQKSGYTDYEALESFIQTGTLDCNNAVPTITPTTKEIETPVEETNSEVSGILYYFYNEQCAFCQKEESVVDEIEQNFPGIKVEQVYMDVKGTFPYYEITGLAKEYGISGTPTFVFIESNGCARKNTGYTKYEGMKKWLISDQCLKEDEIAKAEDNGLAWGVGEPPNDEKTTESAKDENSGTETKEENESSELEVKEENVCLMGCTLDGTCIIPTVRQNVAGVDSYCDITNEWLSQKIEGAACQNNFECKSNFCSNNACYDVTKEVKETKGLVERIIDWLTNVFSWFKL